MYNFDLALNLLMLTNSASRNIEVQCKKIQIETYYFLYLSVMPCHCYLTKHVLFYCIDCACEFT